MKIQYELSASQVQKLADWEAEQDKIWVKEKKLVDSIDPAEPYYGAIGGALTYSFTPTGIGMIVKVTHATGNELDLTDYDEW